MKPSLRIYVVVHESGLHTGVLVRRKTRLFDTPPPFAVGESTEEVADHLLAVLRELVREGDDDGERYLWEEPFETHRITVGVRPQRAIAGVPVIGDGVIPLEFTYARHALPGGAVRILLPRFGWRFVCESASLAQEIIRQLVSTDLLGEAPQWLRAYRHGALEFVVERRPSWLDDTGAESSAEPARPAPVLQSVAEDWVELARRSKLPAVLGDLDALRPHLGLLERKPMPSLVLVGPPGSGKTTFARRVARLFALWRREKRDRRPRLWATSAERLLAGMTYLGMWQQRILDVLRELEGEGDMLYVDRLAPLLRPQHDGTSIGDMLLPSLRAGTTSLLAECSPAEWERCQQQAPQLCAALTPIRIVETPAAEMPALLRLYQQSRAPLVQLHPEGYRRLVQHLELHHPTASFPGKGFRFLESLVPDPETATPRTLYAPDVSAQFARWSGLPLELVSDDHAAGQEVIASRLRARVIGQDEACLTAARVLARFKAGLGDPKRPTGVLLFVGPTGVGKTELAKQLTRYMLGDEQRMIRLDMSEYMLPGSAARLLEVGDGVRSLAERVRQQPLSLVLLDEIEKAHREVFDLLLGVLGEARLTDAAGRDVDFRTCVIVMTSNLGASDAPPVGFGAPVHGEFVRKVREHFRPELFNRIDHVVPFHDLSPGDVARIVDLELDFASERAGLQRRNVRLVVAPELRARIAALGHEPGRGARPLKRIVEELVVTPLAVRLSRDPALRDTTLVLAADGSLREARAS